MHKSIGQANETQPELSPKGTWRFLPSILPSFLPSFRPEQHHEKHTGPSTTAQWETSDITHVIMQANSGPCG
jgi:hypothetical protein